MLDDLKEIEAKGYQNPHSASGAPPLVLNICVRRETKQEMDRKRGNLSSRLLFSLDCAALEPGGASGGDPGSVPRTPDGSDEVKDQSRDGPPGPIPPAPIDAYLRMNDTTSANANHGDYSTILMTCIALTSRAEGSFSITRSKVEFSISCASRIDNSVYESELRRGDNFEYPRHSRDVIPVRWVRGEVVLFMLFRSDMRLITLHPCIQFHFALFIVPISPTLCLPPHRPLLITSSPFLPPYLSPSPSHLCNSSREEGNDSRLRSIETLSVAVIADSSELASAIPSLLDGVGVPASNITILHDFDSTNQVCDVILTFFFHLVLLFFFAFINEYGVLFLDSASALVFLLLFVALHRCWYYKGQ